MFPYLLVFIIAFLYYLCCRSEGARRNQFLLAIFFLYLAIFIGLGDMIGGYDRYIYGEAFDTIANVLRSGENLSKYYYLVAGEEWGYFYWQVLIAYFTENRYIYILITTFLIYGLFYKSIKQYAADYPLAVIVFLGFFYYFTMTYLRQMIACGIVWQGARFIWERRPIPFFLILLLAFSFHSSALVFGLIYFLPQKSFPKQLILLLLLGAFLLGLTPLPLSIFDAIDTERTEGLSSDLQGFRIEYVLEVLFFLVIFLKEYDNVRNKRDVVMFNGLWCFCAFLLLFMRYGQSGRMGWYFFLTLIYLFSRMQQWKKNSATYSSLVTISVCALLFLRITIAWGPLNLPYKTFLTPGPASSPKYMYKMYEYDKAYEENKFYRKIWDPVF